MSGIRSGALIGRRSGYIVLPILFTNDTQKATKVKFKRDESTSKTVNIPRIYSSLEKALEFCWSSFAKDHKTLP